MVNKVILIGRLGADPEVRRLESGAVVAKLRLATSEAYKDKDDQWQEKTEWHSIVAWRYLAEKAERDYKKGKLIYVEGKLTHRKWQDQEGKERYITEVVANNTRLLERRGSSDGSSFPNESDAPPVFNQNQSSTTPATGNNTTTSATPTSSSSSEEVTDAVADDLPF